MANKLYISLFALFCAISINATDFNFIEPEHYLCRKIDADIKIDGNIEKPIWSQAEWTNQFVDIEGRETNKPYFNTKAKMLWNDTYIYFAFELEEEHIWANITERDAVIFYDNDIEIFIDPNGDTHNYFEFELNAFNTVWDLFLAKPYREQGPIINEFDFKGLQTAVQINGTLNDPSDIDKSWTVEVAIPWKNITTAYHQHRPPKHGEDMRFNFSRVQWDTEIKDGKYQKKVSAETSKTLHENNWVWSPTGLINMHIPELWGKVTFVEHDNVGASEFYDYETEYLRQFIAHIYKEQKAYFNQNQKYATSLNELKIDADLCKKYQIQLNTLTHSFDITGSTPDLKTSYLSNTEGRLRKIN